MDERKTRNTISDNWARKFQVGSGTALCMPEPWMNVLITMISSATYVRSRIRIKQRILEIELWDGWGGRGGGVPQAINEAPDEQIDSLTHSCDRKKGTYSTLECLLGKIFGNPCMAWALLMIH